MQSFFFLLFETDLVWARLTLTSRSSCLSLWSAGVAGVHCPSWLLSVFAFHPEHVYWEGSHLSQVLSVPHPPAGTVFCKLCFSFCRLTGPQGSWHTRLALCLAKDPGNCSSSLCTSRPWGGSWCSLHQCFFLCVLLLPLERRAFLRGILIGGHHCRFKLGLETSKLSRIMFNSFKYVDWWV